MLIFMFIILFKVTTKIVLHNLMLKNMAVFSYFLLLQHCISPLSEMLCVFKGIVQVFWSGVI